MGLVYSGALSLGPLCPLAVSGAAAAAADLVTRLGVFTDMSAFLVATPPSFAVALSDTIALIASLTLNIALLVPTPITVQVSGAVAIIAQLEAQIALLTPLIDLFDAAGIFVYAFDGVSSGFGRGMARALSAGFPGAAGASAHANAIILATVTPATWTGLKAFFQGMPVPPAGAGAVYGGSTSIVSLIPILRRALFGVYSSLQARLAGYVKLVAQFSGTLPTPVGAIDAMTGLKAALQAAIAAGPPAADFFLQAALAGIAALNAAAALVAQLQALFGIAGIFVYKFDGATSELGPAITTSLASGWPDSSPPTLNANALVLGTVTPSTWTALQAFFGGA